MDLAPSRLNQIIALRTEHPDQTFEEALQSTLLNNIKSQYPANRIVALDLDRGVAAVELPNKDLRAIPFDTRTLEVR